MRKIILFTLLIVILSCFYRRPVKITTTYISCPIGNKKIAENIHDQDCQGFVNQSFPHKSLNIPDFNDLQKLKQRTGLDWQEIVEFDPFINFKELFDSCNNKIVHIVDIIDLPMQKKNIVSVGSDDGFSLWVNGDSIASIKGGRNLRKDDNLVTVHLKKGKNIIHYKVHNKEGSWALYRDYNYKLLKPYSLKTNMYSDIFRNYIIDDSINSISINHNQYVEEKLQNKLLLNKPVLKINWFDLDNQFVITDISYSEFPPKISLPPNIDDGSLLNLSVNYNGSVEYIEKIPVVYNSFIVNNIKDIISFKTDDSDIIAKQFAVNTLFGLNDVKFSRETDFSSRMKTEVFYDLYSSLKNNDRKSGVKTYGYRSPSDSSIQTYRVFYPEDIYKKEPEDIVIYVPHIRHNSKNFYDNFMGNSHFYFRKLMEMSTLYNKIFVIPYGRGDQNFHGIAKEEILIIINELSKKYERNDFNISYLTSSSGIVITSELLMNYDFPVKDVYAMAIKPNRMDREWDRFFKYLKNKQPDISFHIINGLADDVAPIKETRKWVKIAKKNKVKIEYVESEYLGHLLDLKLLQTTFLDKEWK